MHPYQDSQELRHSLDNLRKRLDEYEEGWMCSCGSKNFNVEPSVETHPQLPFVDTRQTPSYGISKSSCDVLTCKNCGRKVEVAFSLTYSMCVLASNSVDDK